MAIDYGSGVQRFYGGTPATVGTSSTDEAVIDTIDFPDGFLVDNDHGAVKALTHSAAQNSTDTHRYRLRLASLTGPVVADSGANDEATGAVRMLEAWFKVVTAGVGGTAVIVASGTGSTGHPGTTASGIATQGAPLRFVLTGQAGASNAGNSLTGLDLCGLVFRAR